MYRLDEFQAVIFDFGGVIIDVDYRRTSSALERLIGTNKRYQFSKADQADLFDAFETGKLSDNEFRDAIRRHATISDLTDQVIDDAWNAMLGSIPKYRIELLQTIAKTTRIFLLSNTNNIHLRAIADTMTKAAGSPEEFESLFEQVYYSHLMGKRKPNPEVFLELVGRHQLEPASTLFIDDSPQHVAAAQGVGLKAHHLTTDVTKIWR